MNQESEIFDSQQALEHIKVNGPHWILFTPAQQNLLAHNISRC